MTPRVSILIPNFNNGRESSKSGDFDLIGTLLRSLRRTLSGERMPFEIIAYDDGSDDDSLATLRAWSSKRWSSGAMRGEPILRLIEEKHHGCLARTSNILVGEASGDILVRLDGDVEILTSNWVTSLCEIFANGPADLGVVGPKQLASDGRIHSMGDWVLDPRGYIHEGEHAPRDAYTLTIEVDHVMGCFYCCRREVFEVVGGFDETFLRGQTIDFGMTSRLRGYRCWATPAIEFKHHLGLRQDRPNEADSNVGLGRSLGRFREKWGFCRLQPDLDEVRRQYAGTPLLWNATRFGPRAALDQDRQIDIEHGEWKAFAQSEQTRARYQRRLRLLGAALQSAPGQKRFAEVGSGTGLLVHLLAQEGVAATGIDRDLPSQRLAQGIFAGQVYPGKTPQLLHMTDDRSVPLADNSIEVLLLTNEMERHPNPVRLLDEARRVLSPGGTLLVISQRPIGLGNAGGASEHRYTERQLLTQLRHCINLIDTRQLDSHPEMEMVFQAQPEPLRPVDALVEGARQVDSDRECQSHPAVAATLG